MSPPVDVDVGCTGCFLHGRTGGTCPMVRGGYDPEAAEARLRAAALHAAVMQDAQNTPAFAELVRRDAMSRNVALPASTSLGLLPAAPDHLYHDSREEVIHAVLPSRTSR